MDNRYREGTVGSIEVRMDSKRVRKRSIPGPSCEEEDDDDVLLLAVVVVLLVLVVLLLGGKAIN